MDKIKIINEALSIPRVSKRVKTLKISNDQLNDSIIILLDIIQEYNLKEEPKYITSFNLSKNGRLVPTRILSENGKEKKFLNNLITQNITPINTSLRIKDIDQTKERIEVALYLKEYKKDFDKKPKGFYLYGNMGIGKSYISQAMANTLAAKGYSVAFLNIVDLVSTIKSKFSSGYETFINKLKLVDHLFIDDIGAETIVSWFRDEVLLSILSSRMNNNLSTFFTSNYSYEELERYQSRTNGSKYPDKNKSSRLMERIKALTVPISINGKNRRY
ncbi:MAG: ATP-binding protein [Mycoplasma sp.]|nr:ATP-binding protein [Mycoplasma sp.]